MRLGIFSLSLLLAHLSFAQYQLGLRTERYSGASGVFLNPTSQLFNPLKWNVSLVGGGAFVSNSYLTIQQTSIMDLLSNLDSLTVITLTDDPEVIMSQDTYVIDFNDVRRGHFATVFGYVDGPALSARIAKNHAIGVFSRAALLAGTQDFPAIFSYDAYDARPFYTTFSVPKFQGAAMGWKEFGINYAFSLPTYYGSIAFGVNIRKLTTYEGAFFRNKQEFQYTKLPQNMATLVGAISDFGFTTSFQNYDEFKPRKSGNGWAFDLAATALIGEDEVGNYQWKLNVALLDIGWAAFNAAEKHHVGIYSSTTIDYDSYRTSQIYRLNEIARKFSYETLGDSLASLIGNKFLLALPASISLQADYSLVSDLVFFNATLVQHLHTKLPSPKRGNILALTPRAEHRWFTLSTPIVLYNWSRLHLGLSARLGYLVIGTDHLSSLFGKRDFYGTDFYVALKFNPFELRIPWPGGNSSGYGGKKIKKGGKVKCYQF